MSDILQYTPFGTDKTYDDKVNDRYVPSRIKMADKGYGLDKLMYDEDADVRKQVAHYFTSNDICLNKYNSGILLTLANDKSPNVRAEVVNASHGNPEILEKLISDENVAVRCAVANQGYGLERLCKDETEAVLVCVARQGYLIDELINYIVPEDPNMGGNVRDAACEYLHRNGLSPYGSNPLLDNLANNNSWEVRAAVAEQGYGLEKLMKDPSWQVRKAVARNNGFGWYKLMYDEIPAVRAEIAKFGKGLDVLINDADYTVRKNIAHNCPEIYLSRLINDEDPSVRQSVAEVGYGLESLVNDENADVREAVARAVPADNAEIIEILSKDDVWSVRASLAESGKAIDVLCNDPVPAVRSSVALGCSGDKSILSRLYKDPVQSVSHTAFIQMQDYGLAYKTDWKKVENSIKSL